MLGSLRGRGLCLGNCRYGTMIDDRWFDDFVRSFLISLPLGMGRCWKGKAGYKQQKCDRKTRHIRFICQTGALHHTGRTPKAATLAALR